MSPRNSCSYIHFSENDGGEDHEGNGRHKRDSPEEQEVIIGEVSTPINVEK